MKEIRVIENSEGKENRSHHFEKGKGVNKPCSYSLRHSSSVFPAALRASTDVTLTLRAKDQCVCVCLCECAYLCEGQKPVHGSIGEQEDILMSSFQWKGEGMG